MRDGPWDEHADWWIREFTDGADTEYEDQILPLAAAELAHARRLLDVGCGEGQIARRVASVGVEVVGIDPTWACIRTAGARAGGPVYASATVAALPFPDAAFDAIVVSLVFEHLDDLDAAVAEVARVLEPGGRFAFFVNHPILQAPGSVWVEDHLVDPPESYWRLGPYLVESDTVEQVQRGVWVRFVHRPLSRYVNALAEHGLQIERMVEPAPPSRVTSTSSASDATAAYPRLLYLRLRKVG